jgi:SPP1 gp7 family putative phage head morphogenesis protein
MAATRETLRLMAAQQLVIDEQLGTSVRTLTEAWVRAWKIVEREWTVIVRQLAEEVAANGRPSRRTLRRARNIQHGLNTIRALLDAMSDEADGMLAEQSQVLVRDAARKQAKIIGSSLPRGELRSRIEREAQLPNRQLEAIIRRSTQQITSTLRPLSAEATGAVLDQLMVGAARGQNPRRVAAQMLQQVQGAFNGGLSRAINVARTEGLDAHRAAAAASQNQHRDVLEGWQWLSALGTRTCPACWSMHGSKHPLDERGPDGHQQCRCARAPLTKSWSDLGFNIPEPPSLIRDGQQEFRKLPRRQQLEVMGPTRLRALDSGRATWEEFAQLRHNDGWRDGYYVRPVAEFRNRMGNNPAA